METTASGIASKFANNSIVKSVANNTLIKVILFSVFIFGIKDVIVNIFIFFGIESTDIYMYISWVIFLLFLMVILPANNGMIK